MIQLYSRAQALTGGKGKVCSGRYPPKGQVGSAFRAIPKIGDSAGLINAFDAVNGGNLANIY